MPQIEELLTVKEFAAETRQAIGSIYNQISEESCPVPIIRIGRKILFRRTDVEKLKNSVSE